MPIHNRLYQDTGGNLSSTGLMDMGPVLSAEVSVSSSLAEVIANRNEVVPSPESGLALIDTGATRECVDLRVISALRIDPIGSVSVGSAAGRAQQSLYPARLRFPGEGLDIDFSSVIGVDLSGQSAAGQPIVALIGRDIISRCLFVYNGVGGFFVLAV